VQTTRTAGRGVEISGARAIVTWRPLSRQSFFVFLQSASLPAPCRFAKANTSPDSHQVILSVNSYPSGIASSVPSPEASAAKYGLPVLVRPA